MWRRENWLFFLGAIGSVAALVKILEYFKITPEDWGRVLQSPLPNLGSLAWGLLLFVFSFGLSVYGLVSSHKRNQTATPADSGQIEQENARLKEQVAALQSRDPEIA